MKNLVSFFLFFVLAQVSRAEVLKTSQKTKGLWASQNSLIKDSDISTLKPQSVEEQTRAWESQKLYDYSFKVFFDPRLLSDSRIVNFSELEKHLEQEIGTLPQARPFVLCNFSLVTM